MSLSQYIDQLPQVFCLPLKELIAQIRLKLFDELVAKIALCTPITCGDGKISRDIHTGGPPTVHSRSPLCFEGTHFSAACWALECVSYSLHGTLFMQLLNHRFGLVAISADDMRSLSLGRVGNRTSRTNRLRRF
jgi:hypothetical protein